MQVSVTIIARDAGDTLSDCLSGLSDLSDDIIVIIDDRTSDNTAAIAETFTPKIFRRKFIDFADQHNFADSQTGNDWILSLDADETVSKTGFPSLSRIGSPFGSRATFLSRYLAASFL